MIYSNKVVRVFISSTFHDMHAERDHLTRVVLDSLRRQWLPKGVDVVFVDLRWGITKDDSIRLGSTQLCLKEIDRCDIFIVLLGERYGWIPPPDVIPAGVFEGISNEKVHNTEVAEYLSWYARDDTMHDSVYRLTKCTGIDDKRRLDLVEFWEKHGVGDAGLSITEREIRYALRHSNKVPFFAYLRARGVTDHPDFPSWLKPNYVESEDASFEKLLHLREYLQNALKNTAHSFEYKTSYAGLHIDKVLLPKSLQDDPAVDNILRDGVIDSEELSHLQHLPEPQRNAIIENAHAVLDGLDKFGADVKKKLTRILEDIVGSDAGGISPIDSHDAFGRYRASVFVERTRTEAINALTKYVSRGADHRPLIVLGKSGSGKSSLLAAFARHCSEHFPNHAVITYFVGAVPDSTNIMTLVQTLHDKLLQNGCLKEGLLSSDPDQTRMQLPYILEQAAKTRPLIVVIDALNQLESTAPSDNLSWFAWTLPDRVHLVASTIDDGNRYAEYTRQKAGTLLHTLTLEGMPRQEREKLVKKFLRSRGKKLSTEQLQAFLDIRRRIDASLPLYTLVALEELCLMGQFNEIDNRIYAFPSTTAELFDSVLDRIGYEPGREWCPLVFRWLAASRNGLYEHEVLDLLEMQGRPVSRMMWTHFYQSLQFYLSPVDERTGSGAVRFFHDQMRQAVMRKFFAGEVEYPDAGPGFKQAHAELADFYYGLVRDNSTNDWHIENGRAYRALPYHLAASGAKDRLREILTDSRWIWAKVHACSVEDVIIDYDLLPQDETLRLIQNAIRLSAHVIANDKDQLFSQLTGRLLMSRQTQIRDFVAGMQSFNARPWLRPIRPALYQAGGPLIRSLSFHSHIVRCVTVARNGGLAASGSERSTTRPGDSSVKIWDLDSGALVRILRDYTIDVYAVEVTHNNRILITGGKDKEVRLWDLTTGSPFSDPLKGHTDAVSSLCVTPDDKKILTGSYDNTVRIWDLGNGNSRVLGRHDFGVNDVTIVPNTSLVVSGSFDCTLKVWDINTNNGSPVHHLHGSDGHDRSVNALVVTPDGQYVVSASSDCTLKLWNLVTGELVGTFKGHTAEVNSVTLYSCSGRIKVVSGSIDRSIRIWDLTTMKEERVIHAHTHRIYDLKCIPGTSRLISVSEDTSIKIWDLEKIRPDSELPPDHNGYVQAMTVAPDGHLAYTRTSPEDAIVWDIDKEERRFDVQRSKSNSALAARIGSGLHNLQPELNFEMVRPSPSVITPDSRIEASTDNTCIKIIDNSTGLSDKWTDHSEQVTSLICTHDSSHLISSSKDHKILIWDFNAIKEPRPVELQDGHTREVLCVDVSYDDAFLVSVSDDWTLILWDLGAHKPLARFKADGPLVSCAISGNGRIILAGDEAGRIYIVRPMGVVLP